MLLLLLQIPICKITESQFIQGYLSDYLPTIFVWEFTSVNLSDHTYSETCDVRHLECKDNLESVGSSVDFECIRCVYTALGRTPAFSGHFKALM